MQKLYKPHSSIFHSTTLFFFSQTIQCFQLLLELISFQYTRFKANMVYTLTAHIFSKESCMSAGVRSIRKHCIPIRCLNDDAE